MPELMPLPSVAGSGLSVILLAKNAELYLDHLLERWFTVLGELGRVLEVILVDDVSTDATETVFRTAQATSAVPMSLVRSDPPHGIGLALKAGLAATTVLPLVAYAEFSPDFEPQDLRKLLEVMEHVDFASGYRVPGPSKYSGRRLLERWVFGVRLSDPACPFKLFRRHVFDRIGLQSRGDFVHTEIAAKANFLGHVMTEVAVGCQRPISAAPDPFWKQDMMTVFRAPDFRPGPPPASLVQVAESSGPADDVMTTEPTKDGEVL